MNKSVSKSTKSVKSEEVKVETIAPVVEEKVTKRSKKVVEEVAPVVEEKTVKKSKKVADTPAPEVEQPKKEKKSKKVAETPAPEVEQPKKEKKSKKVAETPVPAPESDEGQEHTEAAEGKRRREVSRETVDTEFDSLIEMIHARLESITPEEKKAGVSRLLRNLHKRMKVLKGDVSRISKQRVRGTRQNNTTSGFMKPVKISSDMASFTGWDAGQLRSRVEVTKYICDYIKKNELQNPEDRRQIVPDTKLSKLLGYDTKKEDKPLTYYYLQQKIQPHFVAPVVESS